VKPAGSCQQPRNGKCPSIRLFLEYGKVEAAALVPFLAQYKQVESISLKLTRTREEFYDSLGERRMYTRWIEPLDADSARLLDAPTARRLCAHPGGAG
jgi:hypothetical protein